MLKSRDITLPTKVRLVKAMVFPVVMYRCKSWTVKRAERRRIDAFELWCWRRLLRVPWTARRSNQSILKEISPGIFGRNDAKAETPVLWPLHVKSWLIGKDSDAGRDWGQEEKRTTKDEIAGWHHWLDGRESEWTPGDGDGQGGLACCDSWGCKESDTTEWLNWTELYTGIKLHSEKGRGKLIDAFTFLATLCSLLAENIYQEKEGKWGIEPEERWISPVQAADAEQTSSQGEGSSLGLLLRLAVVHELPDFMGLFKRREELNRPQMPLEGIWPMLKT